MRAHQIMTRRVVTIATDAGIADAASITLGKHISSLPVVDAAGKLVGISWLAFRPTDKGNFKVGMRTEKSRLKRSLLSLRELMRRIRHYKISDQAEEINLVLRGYYAYYGVAGNLRRLVEVYRARGALLAQNAAQPQLGKPTPVAVMVARAL